MVRFAVGKWVFGSCVGTVLCCEADDRVLWWVSLWGSGCFGAVLCSEADEGVLWWVSLWGVGLDVGKWVSGRCFVQRS